MSSPPKIRTLVESEDYKDQIEILGGARDVDEALRAVLWSLALTPTVWPVVKGFKRLRLAWTDPSKGPVLRRALWVWFEIRDNDEAVDLLFIEAAEPEE